MSTLPPRQHLLRVLASLGRHLPLQLDGLLDHPRFAEDAAALSRLADPGHARAAADALAPDEAAMLARVLLDRWAAIGEIQLDPAAAVLGPAEVWLDQRPVEVALAAAVDGFDPGWLAEWTGEGLVAGPAGSATLRCPPPPSDQVVTLSVRLRVTGRAGEQRALAVASHGLALRRPHVTIDPPRTRVVVHDQAGHPGAGVRIEAGDQAKDTDAMGLAVFDNPLPTGVALQVAGVKLR